MEKSIVIHGDLPIFPGFYSTHFEADEDPELENLSDEHGFRVTWDDVEWDYESYRREVAVNVTQTIERVLMDEFGLDFDIEFQDIDSPREYNFRNDQIEVELKLSKKGYVKVIKLMEENREKMEQWLIDKFRSRSGFISFWEHEWYHWMGNGSYLDLDHKDFGCCFMWVLEGLLERVADYDSHSLYNDTEMPNVQGKMVMADTDDGTYDEMFADIYVDRYIEEHGSFGAGSLLVAEAERKAELFSTSVRIEMLEAYADEITSAMVFGHSLPKGRLEGWLNQWEKDNGNREQILEEFESIINKVEV